MPDIVVFGSLNADLVLEVPALPTAGQTVLGGRLRTNSGGKGANQAVAAAVHAGPGGPSVRMVGRVGDDEHGRRMRADLAAAGVDTRHVAVDAAEPSGTALILVDGAGENMIAVAPGANAAVDAGDADRAVARLHPGDVVLCQLEVPLSATAALVAGARSAGARSVCNAAPATALDPEVLAALDVLVVNEPEARIVLGLDAPTPVGAAEAARRSGCAVVVTLGGAGAVWATPDGASGHHPAPSVPVVDTVGAGDAFTGALTVLLATGADLDRAVAAGVTAGSAAVTRAGARTADPAGVR
ncbi:ribokinase [Plantactinospora sp. GCM10030261]|uniref:ribokinase n=1 Tax=Plantactinospora sp. GCM10030261 TaxID=3273420 RepID=UPI003621A5CF